MLAISATDKKDVKTTVDCLKQFASIILVLGEQFRANSGELLCLETAVIIIF